MASLPQAASQAWALLSQLQNDLVSDELSAENRRQLLERLKVIGRNPTLSDAIFAKEGIATLCRYGFDIENARVSQEAMRCLANAMLLNEPARQIFLDLGYSGKAAEKIKNDDRDDEFLATRILFYTTYTGNLDIDVLVEKHDLTESITQNIKRHAQWYREGGPHASTSTPMEKMSMDESLKIIPNLLYYRPSVASRLSGSIPHILAILEGVSLPSPPLQPPISLLINALMNLELSIRPQGSIGHDAVFPSPDERIHTRRLITILDTAIKAYAEKDLDHAVTPLVTLLRKIYEAAPQTVQSYMCATLLPDDKARDKPLGKDASLPSRLLQLSIAPLLSMLRDSISSLLFELSDKDPTKLIQNIGYGYASGILMSHNIAVPEAAMQEDDVSAGASSASINPVTGQRRDAEPEDTGPPMTYEEKEREAERLFVLFERLRATGVIDVKNPVQQAMEEGRFEEVDSD